MYQTSHSNNRFSQGQADPALSHKIDMICLAILVPLPSRSSSASSAASSDLTTTSPSFSSATSCGSSARTAWH